MRWYRHKTDGKERLWIEEEEFDSVTEAELRAASLYPTSDRPAVDIERFIQRHMGATLDQHADLGDGIAGAIEFSPTRIKILVSRQLTNLTDEVDCPPGVLGRWRATMAHEAAHGLLHRRLFETSPSQGTLFELPLPGAGNEDHIIQCANNDIGFDLGNYDWREYQANRGMACLLMPRKSFIAVAKAESARLACPIWPGSWEHRTLVRCLSVSFEVSRHAATIRLKALEQLIGIGQSQLVAAPK